MKTMTCRAVRLFSFVLLLGLTAPGLRAQAPLLIDNIADKATYNLQTWFRVPSTSGYLYQVLLDGRPMPVDVTNWVTKVDYHEISVARTNLATGAVSNRLVRFIIMDPARGETERGLTTWIPYPVVNSTSGELAGAHLEILMPSNYPAGLEIPVVAWIKSDEGQVVRANGLLTAAGHPSIQLRRGVGSGFLAATHPAGDLQYAAQLPGIQTNRVVEIESVSTWTTVSATINTPTTWSADSRIAITADLTINAGATLTIEAGTVVRLNSGVNITNNGRMAIQGTASRPVVFTPVTRAQPWGGLFLMNSTSQMDAENTIFIASGSRQSGFPGHRNEQPLFFMDNQARAGLTNCAAIYLAGQFFHSNNRGTSLLNFTMVRSLVQRCTTGGEFFSVSFKFIESAFIEVPFDSGEYGTEIDSDYDGLYLDIGNYEFRDSLIGWVKDDCLDSGSGSGPVNILMTNCWLEASYHEGGAWSNIGREITNAHMVVINCGQGIENGWSGGCTANSPNVRVLDSLSLANGIGVRHGDNYGWEYDGFLWLSNSIVIHNYRDVWGINTDTDCTEQGRDWRYRSDLMDVRDNLFTQPNTNHPNNLLWNPAADAWRLAGWLTTPPDAPVGIGIATWTNQFPITNLLAGVPVRLSSFTTNFVSVEYAFENADVAIASGTVIFAPGETLKLITPSGFNAQTQSLVRAVLRNPAGGELTGRTNIAFTGALPAAQVSLAVAANLLEGSHLLEGTFVRLSLPVTAPVSLDYSYSADGETLQSGTLQIDPLETQKQLFLTTVNPSVYPLIQLTVGNATNATLTGTSTIMFTNPPLNMFLAVATNQLSLAALSNGVPIGLTGGAPEGTRVDFRIEGNRGGFTNGTLFFAPNEISKFLFAPTVLASGEDFVGVTFMNATPMPWAGPDTVYYVRVVAAPPGVAQTLIARGTNSIWRYRDAASAAPANWATNTFNDSSWPQGPAQLGFSNSEEDDEATLIADNNQITSYFRRSFVVADPAAFTNLSMWMLRDDGGVVYLNGREAFRSPNLPALPTVITYSTTTLSGQNGENTIDTTTLAASLLRAGTNLAAVEIHQQGATSSDVSFNFELIGNPAPPPPPPQTLYWGQLSGGNMLAWGDTSFALEQSTNMAAGSWTLTTNRSPFVIIPSGAQMFYRLRR